MSNNNPSIAIDTDASTTNTSTDSSTSNPIKIVTIIVKDTIDYDEVHIEELIKNKINATIDLHGVISASAIQAKVTTTSPSSATAVTSNTSQRNDCKSKCSQEKKESLAQSILRHLQQKDKITQLTSTLLKSWLYHFYSKLYHGFFTLDQNHDRSFMNMKNPSSCSPIVVLSRTKYKKPYIELEIESYLDLMKNKINKHGNSHTSETKTLLTLPFSVSHQYPITAISFISIEPNYLFSSQIITNNKNLHLLPLIGIDVVTFDSKQKRKTTTDEYLSCFKSSFTPWEWQQIQIIINNNYNHTTETNHIIMNNDREKFISFFLRWAMKEAYTKALGVGLGKEFNSFETHLIGFDVHQEESNDDDGNHKLWDVILRKSKSNCKGIAYFPAYLYDINNMNQRVKRDDSWSFYFLPILSSNSSTDSDIGCLCVCVQNGNNGNLMQGFNSTKEMIKCFSNLNMTLDEFTP